MTFTPLDSYITADLLERMLTWDEKETTMPNETTRVNFERAVYAEYFIRGVKFVEGKQFAEVRNQKPKSELLERGDGDRYKDEIIDAMWFGWCLAMEEANAGH